MWLADNAPRHRGTPRPRARHRTWCQACGLYIDKGETYVRTSLVYAGRAYSWRAHVECHRELERLKMPDDGYPELCLDGSYYGDDELSDGYRAWRDTRRAQEVENGREAT